MSARVGGEVEAWCGRCGGCWHIVLAKVGSSIAKVECGECHGVHRYRDPRGSKTTTAAQKGTLRSSRARPSAKDDPEVVEANLEKPVQEYKTGHLFERGDRISHVTFGPGVAQHSPGPGKITILFAAGPKLLKMAKAPPRS